MKHFLKKLIRAFLCLWTLLIFFSPNLVHAELGEPSKDGSQVFVPYAAAFANNSNGNLTRLSSPFDSDYSRWTTNAVFDGANRFGVNIGFDAIQPFVAGYTYAVTILIGFPSNSSIYAHGTDGKVCIAETLDNAFTRFTSGSGFTCPSATSHHTTGTGAYFTNTNGTTQYQSRYGLITYVFTSNLSMTSVTMAFNTNRGYNGSVSFGGYSVQLLSDNRGLTNADLQSALHNSGFATANDIDEVNTSLNQVKTELSGIDNTMNDSSVDSSDNTLNGLKQNLPTNSVISDLILLPVTFLQKIVNALGGSCSSFSLGNMLGTDLFLPCINIESYLGSTIWTFVDLIFSGMFVLVIRKKFVQIFNNITQLKDRGNEVE